MVTIFADPVKHLLTFKFIGHIAASDIKESLEVLTRELEKLETGFVVFTDLSELSFMENAATSQIAICMDRCASKGVGRIVRLIPQPSKDVGFALIGIFHNEKHMRAVTCEDREDALRLIAD